MLVQVDTPALDASPERTTYRRSSGTKRGEARRRQLLERVTDDLAINGLVDFSLRRAAKAAGTTHKVLLYHFDGADDLLVQAILSCETAASTRAWPPRRWPGKSDPGRSGAGSVAGPGGEESRVLDQAIGLMMYDTERYAELGRGASQQYLPSLLSLCPADWTDQRKLEVARDDPGRPAWFPDRPVDQRGHLGVDAGFEALGRALDREEASSE